MYHRRKSSSGQNRFLFAMALGIVAVPTLTYGVLVAPAGFVAMGAGALVALGFLFLVRQALRS